MEKDMEVIHIGIRMDSKVMHGTYRMENKMEFKKVGIPMEINGLRKIMLMGNYMEFKKNGLLKTLYVTKKNPGIFSE